MRFLVSFFLLLTPLYFWGQDTIVTRFSNSETLAKDQVFLAKDIYDNTYVREKNVLKKLSKYNSSLYQNPRMGDLTMVDLTLALSPLVFYKQEQTVFILSRELAQVNQIDFSEKFPNMQGEYVASSNGRRMWIVDHHGTGAIRLYNISSYERHLVYTLQSTDNKDYYSTLTHFFWVDKNNVLHGINTQGKVVVNYPLPFTYDKMQILDSSKLFYLHENKLYYVDITRDKIYPIQLADKSILGFFYNIQKLSIFVEEKLNNYLIKLP
ncbi:hypothetical protein [Myroides sp. LJL110]